MAAEMLRNSLQSAIVLRSMIQQFPQFPDGVVSVPVEPLWHYSAAKHVNTSVRVIVEQTLLISTASNAC